MSTIAAQRATNGDNTALRRNRRARIAWGAALIAACIVAVCVLIIVRSVIAAGRSLHPPRLALVPPPLTGPLQTMRDVSFVTIDHLTIRGWYIPSRNHAAVILTHGLMANRTQMLFEARALAEAGFGVLLFDSRGQGASDGDLVTWGDRETRDVTAALDFVDKQPEVAPDRIGGMGCSMGGFVLADLAATDTRLRAITVSAMYTTLEANIRSDYQKWGRLSEEPAIWAFRHAGVDVDAVRPIDAVGKIGPRPILFFNGTHDPDSPVWAQNALYNAARPPKSRWDIDGVLYGDLSTVAPDAYRRRLLAFFESNLLSTRRTTVRPLARADSPH